MSYPAQYSFLFSNIWLHKEQFEWASSQSCSWSVPHKFIIEENPNVDSLRGQGWEKKRGWQAGPRWSHILRLIICSQRPFWTILSVMGSSRTFSLYQWENDYLLQCSFLLLDGTCHEDSPWVCCRYSSIYREQKGTKKERGRFMYVKHQTFHLLCERPNTVRFSH